MSYKSPAKTSLLRGTSFCILAASTVPVMAQQAMQNELETIIVTGTRITGLTAADSAAPITLVDGGTLERTAAPTLIGSMLQVVPSFEAEAHSGDTGTLMLSARLRGLNPNHTLVLVNGKRRHGTANLHVLAGAYQGSAAPDLDMIPPAAIERIEILQDGAAAQYGSDAIAGVINIILKSNNSGGSFAATGGEYYEGDGASTDFVGNLGFDLGGKGFLSITAENRHKDFTNRNGPDRRVTDSNGVPLPGLPYDPTVIPGFPIVGSNIGQAQSELITVFFNSEYDISPSLTLYSHGSYGHRDAKSYGTYRPPNQSGFVALQYSNQQYLPPGSPNPGCGNGITPDSGLNPCYQRQVSSYAAPGALIFSTIGFRPQIGLDQDDYSFTFGGKGEINSWTYDISGTYGRDHNGIFTLNSGNGSLWTNTHISPTSFYDGAFVASELTFNADVTRDVEVGLASPLNVAFGFEGRRNTYEIREGEEASYYGIGAANFPGFGPANALSVSRENYAGYVDLAVSPTDKLFINLAGRYEHYTDFGNTTNGKITARYDFNPAIAVRGTLSSGFRAPTLAEGYYTQTNVTPTAATVVLGPNSAAAQIEGLPPLGPEHSTNYSFGLVTRPLDMLSVTVDYFRIEMRDRIVSTGTVPCTSNGVVINQTVCDALAATGQTLDPSVTSTGTTAFTNSLNTTTEGVDVAAGYFSDFGNWGTVNWTLAGTWYENNVSSFDPSPPVLEGVSLQDPKSISTFTTQSPEFKLVFGAFWKFNSWTVNLREVVYGPTLSYVTPGAGGTASVPPTYVVNGQNYYPFETDTTGITDLDVSYNFTDKVSLTVGASNLFDEKAPTMGYQTNGRPLDGSATYNAPQNWTPWGINGGYYFSRLSVKW